MERGGVKNSCQIPPPFSLETYLWQHRGGLFMICHWSTCDKDLAQTRAIACACAMLEQLLHLFEEALQAIFQAIRHDQRRPAIRLLPENCGCHIPGNERLQRHKKTNQNACLKLRFHKAILPETRESCPLVRHLIVWFRAITPFPLSATSVQLRYYSTLPLSKWEWYV